MLSEEIMSRACSLPEKGELFLAVSCGAELCNLTPDCSANAARFYKIVPFYKTCFCSESRGAFTTENQVESPALLITAPFLPIHELSDERQA